MKDLLEDLEWQEDMTEHYQECQTRNLNPREVDPVDLGFMLLVESFVEFHKKNS